MKKKKVIVSILIMLFLLSLSCMASNVSAEEAVDVVDDTGSTPPPPTVNPGTPIYYDDGTAEYGICVTFHDEYKFAVYFTPPFTPAIVDSLIFYITDFAEAEPLIVHVLDSTWADLIAPFEVTPLLGDWTTVDLSSYGIVVTGDFALALEYTTKWKSYMGLDADEPHHDRSYYYGATDGWQLWPKPLLPDGDFLIRAVVEEVPPPVIPEYPLGTIMGLVACFAAFAVFVRSKRSRPHLSPTKI